MARRRCWKKQGSPFSLNSQSESFPTPALKGHRLPMKALAETCPRSGGEYWEKIRTQVIVGRETKVHHMLAVDAPGTE
jgi:hypothetical protein